MVTQDEIFRIQRNQLTVSAQRLGADPRRFFKRKFVMLLLYIL